MTTKNPLKNNNKDKNKNKESDEHKIRDSQDGLINCFNNTFCSGPKTLVLKCNMSDIVPIIEKELPNRRIVLFVDSQINRIYNKILSEITESLQDCTLFVVPQGEQYKTRETKQRFEDLMLDKGFGRDSAIVAIGGGVTTDLSGFIASTFCRSIPWIVIPTTLLAMIDSSIGGKTGVDTHHGKNLIGAFHRPKAILIDPSFLNSLPLTEILNGMAEIIKIAITSNSELFSLLEDLLLNHASPIQDLPELQAIISCAIRLKQEITDNDAQENSVRAILNFGHTIAHGIETSSGLNIPHGTAVAFGILTEARISNMTYNLNDSDLCKINNIILNSMMKELLSDNQINLHDIDIKNLLKSLNHDKKAILGSPRFVLPSSIGSVVQSENLAENRFCIPVQPEIVKKALIMSLDNISNVCINKKGSENQRIAAKNSINSENSNLQACNTSRLCPDALMNLRSRIDHIDSKILQQLALRDSLIATIKTIKTESGLPIQDSKRENEKIDRIREDSERLHLDPDTTEKIFTSIIKTSRDKQLESFEDRQKKGEGVHHEP